MSTESDYMECERCGFRMAIKDRNDTAMPHICLTWEKTRKVLTDKPRSDGKYGPRWGNK